MISATVVKADSTPVSSVGTSPIVVGCESHDDSLGWKRKKVGAAHLDPWRLAYPGGVSFSKELSALPPRRVEIGGRGRHQDVPRTSCSAGEGSANKRQILPDIHGQPGQRSGRKWLGSYDARNFSKISGRMAWQLVECSHAIDSARDS